MTFGNVSIVISVLSSPKWHVRVLLIYQEKHTVDQASIPLFAKFYLTGHTRWVALPAERSLTLFFNCLIQPKNGVIDHPPPYRINNTTQAYLSPLSKRLIYFGFTKNWSREIPSLFYISIYTTNCLRVSSHYTGALFFRHRPRSNRYH